MIYYGGRASWRNCAIDIAGRSFSKIKTFNFTRIFFIKDTIRDFRAVSFPRVPYSLCKFTRADLNLPRIAKWYESLTGTVLKRPMSLILHFLCHFMGIDGGPTLRKMLVRIPVESLAWVLKFSVNCLSCCYKFVRQDSTKIHKTYGKLSENFKTHARDSTGILCHESPPSIPMVTSLVFMFSKEAPHNSPLWRRTLLPLVRNCITLLQWWPSSPIVYLYK